MPAPKGSDDSTIENSCPEVTSGMVGVDWLWAQTEEVSMEDTCRHRIVRAACSVVLAYDSVLWMPSGDGVLLPLPVTCDRQYIQEQTQEAL